jgi:DNA polymerase-2
MTRRVIWTRAHQPVGLTQPRYTSRVGTSVDEPGRDETQPTLEGCLLSRSQREAPRGLVLEYWLATATGPVRACVRTPSAVFFVPRDLAIQAGQRKEVQLRAADGTPVDAVYFRSLRALRDERDRLLRAGQSVLEGDVLPSDRYLMERFITGSCRVGGERVAREGFIDVANAELQKTASSGLKLRAASIDIETDGFEGPVLSIALVCDELEQVYMRGAGQAPPHTELHATEAGVITAFCRAIARLDPDLILGWNVVEFDLTALLRRAGLLGIALTLGRDGSEPSFTSGKPVRARVAGRVVLDGIGALRAASYMLESYALQDVAERFLGRGKAIAAPHGDRVAEIRRMFEHDRTALAHYNLEDCRLVRDIFAHTDLIDVLTERAQLTGLALDRVRGAVAAYDFVYLPRLHRAGFVAPTVVQSEDFAASPGGYVLDSIPGLYDNVIVLDFKSLYPSIIRTFRIDPLGLWIASSDERAIPGFSGARFARERHILPELIAQLWHSRDDAKARNDAARSYAIKILMNSFYGVLGTPACRFFDPKLASSITLRGHEIITHSRRFLEAAGHRVIYGDTDSLFVHVTEPLDPAACAALGEQLARALNDHWRERIAREHALDSQLEVQFDTHYLRFFMPTLRDSNQGSKKRYAGLTQGPAGYEVAFTGLEAVRSDWTPLARRFQRELYRRVFRAEPYVPYVREIVAELFAGRFDAELVYKKRLRRELDAYTKNVPPHVRAARKLGEVTREIAYVMTPRGPEPADGHGHTLDYRHYLERQLAPAADTLLIYLGTSLERLIDRQLSLF